MIVAHVGMGSNTGDRRAVLATAAGALAAIPATRRLGVSSVYESVAVGDPRLPSFLNAGVRLSTGLSARDLLERLLAIEEGAGRGATGRHRARRLDLDLLAFGDRVLREEGLIVPHPRLSWRPFALLPMVELDPGWRHPEHGMSAAAMVHAFPARGDVRWAGRLVTEERHAMATAVP
jgi:2-amino-4-hydroxy-6-hydroxymethyldihydropteridine diphosphokinase